MATTEIIPPPPEGFVPIDADPPAPEGFVEYKPTGVGEAFGSGALQGLSLGFADEAIGAVQGALDKNKTIAEKIEENRQHQQQLEQEHPIASTIGDVAGSLAPAAASVIGTIASGGAAAPTLAPTAGKAVAGIGKLIGKTALKGAAQGALSGVGYSDVVGSNDPEAFQRGIANASIGAGIGGVASKAVPAAGRLIKGLKGKLGKQIMSGVSEVDEEAINYLMNPATRARMATTKTMPVIGEELVQKADDAVKNIRAMSGESFGILKNTPSKESAFQLKNIFIKNADELAAKNKLGTYDSVINDLRVRGDRLEKSYISPTGQSKNIIYRGGSKDLSKNNGKNYEINLDAIDKIKSPIMKSENIVPLDDVKNMIWELDDAIQYNPKNLTPAEKIQNDAYKKIRGELNERLRASSPEYATIMDKISKQTQDLKNFRDAFKNNPETIGKQISEYMKLERLGRDKTKKISALDDIAKYAGKDFLDEAKAVWARDQFEKQIGKGSTNANIGIAGGVATIGTALTAVGMPMPIAMAIGGAIGGIVGKHFNRYGAKMTRMMLEKYIDNAADKEVPYILKKPLMEFRQVMKAIPDAAKRRVVANSILHNMAMDQDKNQEITPAGMRYAFDRIAR